MAKSVAKMYVSKGLGDASDAKKIWYTIKYSSLPNCEYGCLLAHVDARAVTVFCTARCCDKQACSILAAGNAQNTVQARRWAETHRQ